MKAHILVFLMFFLLNGTVAYGQDYRYLIGCVKITNINDYPDISMLTMSIDIASYNDPYRTYREQETFSHIIPPDDNCMIQSGKSWPIEIFAVKKSYLIEKDVYTTDWSKDLNAVASSPKGIIWYPSPIPVSSPLSRKYEYYKILGFTAYSVVLHKWKSVYTFKDHRPDSVICHPYTGDVSTLSQTFVNRITGIPDSHYNASIVLFPNPAHKSFSLKFNDTPGRSISVKIFTPEGKNVRTYEENIPGNQNDLTFPVESLAKGLYFVKIHDGAAEAVKKLVIE